MSGYIVLSSSGEKLVKIKEKGELSKIIYKLVSKLFAFIGAASETEAGKETGHKVHRPVLCAPTQALLFPRALPS